MVPFESTTMELAKPEVAPRNFTAKPGSTAAGAAKLPSRRRRNERRAVIRAVAKPERCQPQRGKYKCEGRGCYGSLTIGDAATIIAPLSSSGGSQSVSRGGAVW